MFSREKNSKRIVFLSVVVLMSGFALLGDVALAEQTSEKKESASSFYRPSLLMPSPKKNTEYELKVDSNKKNKKSNKRSTKKTDSFAMKMLPLSYGDWVLDVKNMHSPGNKQCVAINSGSMIDDGHSGSSVTVEVTSKAVRIYTESLVDVSYLDLGIAVDQFERIDIDSIFSDTNVIFNFHVNQLIAQMRKGDKAVLTLGFWPAWPMTHAYSTNISLSGFTKVMNKLSICNKRIT